MSNKSGNRTLAVTILAFLAVPGMVWAASIHGVDVTTVANNNSGYSTGWEFVVTQPISITHVGKFTGTNPAASSDVAIYAKATGGAQYALGTVLSTSPSEASGAISARYEPLASSVRLNPGEYVVYAQAGSESFVENASAAKFGPGIGWISGIANSGTSPLPSTTPDFAIHNTTLSRYYGGTFKYDPLIPDPGTTVYIGDAASQGKTFTAGGGTRADTVDTLTYASTAGANEYASPSAHNVRLTEVNFFCDNAGTLRPYVARYSGGNNQQGASYTVLAMGDPIVVTDGSDHLVNASFTVGGVNPVVSLAAGDTLVAGWQQAGQMVFISGYPASGVPEYIANGAALPASVGNPLTLNSTWAFDRTMQFNVGFELVEPSDIPEPATLALLGLAVTGLGGYIRRRRAA